jgi:methyl-accepting chemotaxis protein
MDRPSAPRRRGLLSQLAFIVFGGFALLLAGIVAIGVVASYFGLFVQGEVYADFQLAYARAAILATSAGGAPRADGVAAVRQQLAAIQPGLVVRVFDHGVPLGDALALDALDAEGVSRVRSGQVTRLGLRDMEYPGIGGFRFYAPLASDRDVVLSVRFPILMQRSRSGRLTGQAVGAVAALMLAICLGLFFLLRRTTRRITRLSQAVADMANTGDFTRALPPEPKRDEIGDLHDGVRALMTLLRATAGALRGASSGLAAAGKALTETAGEQSKLLTQHTRAMEEAAVSAEEIRRTSETAARRAEEVQQSAERAGELGSASERAVQQTLEGLGEIRSQVKAMGEQISVVAERARQISGITQSVKDLADSSNMLALNASIEAVRSGEHGKGFALVAREMRSLADQSIRATERVREILDDVGIAIQQASAMSSRGTQRIESGLSQLGRSGESVRALAQMVSESSHLAQVIAAAVRQQDVGIGQIVRSLADQRELAKRSSESLALTQAHAEELQSMTQQVSKLLESYEV